MAFPFLLCFLDLYMWYACSVLFSVRPLTQVPKEAAISKPSLYNLLIFQRSHSSNTVLCQSKEFKMLLWFLRRVTFKLSGSGTHRNAIFRGVEQFLQPSILGGMDVSFYLCKLEKKKKTGWSSQQDLHDNKGGLLLTKKQLSSITAGVNMTLR